MKDNSNKIQPIIKHKPPSGVIGPRIAENDSMPNNWRVANRYNEPEKNRIPNEKLQPANTNVCELILLAKNATASKAKT